MQASQGTNGQHRIATKQDCSTATPGGMLRHMASIVDIEKLALSLPEKQRATLAANLLESLPGVLSDEDEEVAEALRRDADLDANPDQASSP